MGTQRTALHLGLVLIAATALPRFCAFAQSPVSDPSESTSVAAASDPALLPDAPSAQLSSDPPVTGNLPKVPIELQPHPPVLISNFLPHAISDFAHVDVSPTFLRKSDFKWLIPLGLATTAAFATDTTTMTDVVSSNPSFNQSNITLSDNLRYSYIAAPAVVFGAGAFRHNEHAKETGILGYEAMGDAFALDEIIKLSTWRERPQLDHAQGEFFAGDAGPASSFASGHSMTVWSTAAVFADEYPSKWVKVVVYTGATTVSLARVLGQQHFPSDVLLGGAGGWLIGHYVFRAHHHWSQPHPQPQP